MRMENLDLWKWLTAQEQPPEAVEINPVFTALHDKVMNNLNSHPAPETQATSGQPWVRGWDDIKKVGTDLLQGTSSFAIHLSTRSCMMRSFV
ncbi:succinate dehydrogenase assembly factor 2, mitochondrial-like isoform X2 [Castanea sativa]|uniref:succinate dehydrogenase assembly factor 2, mitochondrial-like isoform X2 n=1 Tax=Castanea sativa TaxID=21020 RepID=UPI003F64C05A